MNRKAAIDALLAAVAQGAGDDDRRDARVAARAAWALERIAALKAMQQRVDEAWARLFEARPDLLADDDDEREAIPDPPEQAELDAILAEIDAVRDHDRWPKQLCWGDV